jgi:hypothetical protein
MKVLILAFICILTLPLSYAALSDGLEEWLPLQINISDLSGYNRAVVNAAPLVFTTGPNGLQALNFSNLQALNTTLARPSAANLTVAFWMLANGDTANRAVLSRDIGAFNNIRLETGSSIKGYMGNSAAPALSFNYPANRWMYYVITANSTGSSLYVNGSLIDNGGQGLGNNIAAWILGRNPAANNAFLGNASISQFAYWNRTLNTTEISTLYTNNGIVVFPVTNFSITATDIITNRPLQNISARLFNETFDVTFNTTDYQINTSLLTNSTSLFNITVNSSINGGYFSRNYSNVNISSAFNASIWQATASFTVKEYITNNTLSVGNITLQGVNYAKTATFNLTSNVSNATFFHQSYFNKTKEFTINPLSVNSFLIENVSNAQYNITGRNLIGGSTITAFNLSVYSVDYGTWINAESIATNLSLPLINGTYYAVMDASGFALRNVTINATVNTSIQNLRFDLYTTNSINFTFRDEVTNALISGPNITLQLISDLAGYNTSTNTGSAYIDLLSPTSYTIRYSAPGYAERFGYFELTNRTSNTLTLYMLLNSMSQNLTTTVVDAAGFPIENALIKLLRYNFPTNSYLLRESVITSNQGTAVLAVTLGTEFYKFIVEYPIGTTALETTPEYLYTNTKTLALVESSDIFAEYNEILNSNVDVSFNNVTNSFRGTYSNTDSSVTSGCLKVYRVYVDRDELYNQSCVSQNTATILLGVEPVDGRTYRADLHLTVAGVSQFADSDSYVFQTEDPFGKTAIFILFIAVLFVVMIFAYNPVLGLPAAGLVALGLQWAGVVVITPWWPFALFAIGILSAILIRRHS